MDFERSVYAMTARIPRGRVTSYREIARAIGRPRAYRAVGNTLNKNPFPVSQVPCHRVIRGNGALGGYGLEAGQKEARLAREGCQVEEGRVFDYSAHFISSDELMKLPKGDVHYKR